MTPECYMGQPHRNTLMGSGPALFVLCPGRVPLRPDHVTPSCVQHTLPHATGPVRYSPNVGEEEFCELRSYGVLGSCT
jgi:hypothetical protein